MKIMTKQLFIDLGVSSFLCASFKPLFPHPHSDSDRLCFVSFVNPSFADGERVLDDEERWKILQT